MGKRRVIIGRVVPGLLGIVGGLGAGLVAFVVLSALSFAYIMDDRDVSLPAAGGLAMLAGFVAGTFCLLGVLGGIVAWPKPRTGGTIMLVGGIGGLVAGSVGFTPLAEEIAAAGDGWMWIATGLYLVLQGLVIVAGLLAQRASGIPEEPRAVSRVVRWIGLVLAGLAGLAVVVALLGSFAARSQQAAGQANVTATVQAAKTATAAARSQNIELVGQIGGPAWDVFVQDNYAYIAALESGLRVIDVSNPAVPVEVGSCDTSGPASGVYVSGSYAYLTTGESGLRVIDISNPARPSEVSSCDTRGPVFVSRSHAYVGGRGLRVVDVSNPAAPVELSSYETPDMYYCPGVFAVYVSGLYAYTVDTCRGLRVIDVSDPASPREVGSHRSFGDSVHVSSSYAYVAAGSAGLQVIDVSNPARPFELGSGATGTGDFGGGDVQVSGSYAYVALGDLLVLDISNPAAPVEVGYFAMPGYAQSLHVSSPYVCVAAGEDGLFILRMAGD